MELGNRIKKLLVGTVAGHVLEDCRSLVERLAASPSAVGTIANDAMASRLIAGLARGQRNFVDVGAHIGSVVARVRREAPETAITAVEAIPEKAESLRTKFPDIKVHAYAVGDDVGEVTFFVNRKASGYSSLARTDGSAAIRVPLQRLDNLIDLVDVIKLDIEGAELGALRGAERLVMTGRPIAMFESAPGAGASLGFSLEDMFAWWSSKGYGLYVPNRVAHDGPPLTMDSFIESHAYPRRTTNYFAIPDEKRIDVRDRARAIVGTR